MLLFFCSSLLSEERIFPMEKYKRRDFLRMTCAGSAALLMPFDIAKAQSVGNPDSRPNILYIMSDDHSAYFLGDQLSRFGIPDVTDLTPNINRLISEGMYFNNSFCTNSLCGPSRAVLLTGKYSHVNGKLTNQDNFDQSQTTFPKLLYAAGYQTALFGKWHLGHGGSYDPQGFTYWKVIRNQGAYFNSPMYEKGIPDKQTWPGYVTDAISDDAVTWIENRDPDTPFCLMVHNKAPHAKWQPAPRHESLFDSDTLPEPTTFNDDYSNRADPIEMSPNKMYPKMVNSWVSFGSKYGKEPLPPGLTPQEQKEWVYQQYAKDYMRVLKAVDDNVGKLLDCLDAEGIADNTIVIYTSDNGMYVGEHGLMDKRFMYEQGLRIPLIVRYPGAIAAGSTTDRFSLNVDYAPTILDFAGVSIPADIQGKSLRTILEGGTPSEWRTSLYNQYFEYPEGPGVVRHYGLRTERYKLIHFYPHTENPDMDQWELFDLSVDPDEMNSVYDNPAYATVLKDLKDELEALRRQYECTEPELKDPTRARYWEMY